MQALILAGGEGTRLRPLTRRIAKPVMPLAGRPFLTFMLDWLRRHGVEEALLCCGFRADGVRATLGERYRGMRLRYLCEDVPLGTAGPIRLAADEGLLDERFLVLNGDVLTDLDLSAQLEQHRSRGALATLALVAVEETSSYGLVPTTADGEVEAFLEKSSAPASTNRINAGAYVLEREVVRRIPAYRPVSIEREVFPVLVGRGLSGYLADGYWVDIGTPKRYLEATYDLLSGLASSELPPRRGGALVLEGCSFSGVTVTPGSVVGPGCKVGRGSVIERSVLHAGVSVGGECRLRESVLADGVSVGDRVSIGPDVLVGEGATIPAGARVPRGARVEPGDTYGAGQEQAEPQGRRIGGLASATA